MEIRSIWQSYGRKSVVSATNNWFHTGELVLYCACSMNRQPSCLLFSNTIDSLVAVWLEDISMPVIDCLEDEFLTYVKDGMEITVKEDGVVCVQ